MLCHLLVSESDNWPELTLHVGVCMEQLPLWFLLLSLFLPRVSLIAAFFLDDLNPYSLGGWLPPTLAIFVPRVLMLIIIFQDRGFSAWILIHSIALVFIYLAAGDSGRGGGQKSREPFNVGDWSSS